MRNRILTVFAAFSLFSLMLLPVHAYDGDSFFGLPIVGATFSNGDKLEIDNVTVTYDGKFIEFRYHLQSKGGAVETDITLDFPSINVNMLGSLKRFANRNKPNIFSVEITEWNGPKKVEMTRSIWFNQFDLTARFKEIGDDWLSIFETGTPVISPEEEQAFKDAGGVLDLKADNDGWMVKYRSSTRVTVSGWTYIHVRYEPLRGAPVMDRLMQLDNGITLDLDGDLDDLCLSRYQLRDLLFVASQLVGDDVILPYHAEYIDFDLRDPLDPTKADFRDYGLIVKTKTGGDVVTTCEGELQRLSLQQYQWHPKAERQKALKRIWFIINEKN